MQIPVEISARHCHLSKQDMEALFGADYKLTNTKQLSQPADFACQETVDIQVGTKRFQNVRVVGPLREQTQIEISITDAIGSGVMPPIRLSGNLKKSPGATLFGPAGSVELFEGLIVARRHLHCATEEAEGLKLKNKDIVSIKIEGGRAAIFGNVTVRVRDDYKLCLHLDTDEGNACGINKNGQGEIAK